jgi:hypothetical protein
MWILSFFPDFLVHLILAAGTLLFLAATFLGMIPLFNTYKTPAQILGIILLSIGIYLEGGMAYKDKIALEVAELQTKLAQAQAKSEETNTQIVTKVVKDTKVIHQKGDDVIKYIDREIVKYDNQCVIPNDVIKAYNEAATLGTSTTVEPEKPKFMLAPKVNQ